MDKRSDAFIRKFSSAQKYLGCNSIQDIVSVKYRDGTNYSDYREFIDVFLRDGLNLELKQVQGDFQGQTWLVAGDRDNKILLIEHETGLEVLYIAGSIASLIGLIPLINSGWKVLHSRFSDHPFFRGRGTDVEIRIVDPKNQIVEKHVLRVEDYILSESMKEILTLRTRVEELEQELTKTKNVAKKSNRSKSIRPAQRIKK
jgi:hypothetical protein